MMSIALAAALSYARCPLEWFLAFRVGIPRPHTPAALAAHGLSQALSFYYNGYVTRPSDGVLVVWRDWCAEWGQPALADELARYTRGRSRILNQFEQGHLHAPGGRRYKAPAWTAKYRELMHREGLLALGARLDAFGESQGLRLPPMEDAPPGSRFADPLADSLTAAERTERNSQTPLPAREVVLGLNLPYTVDLEGGLTLTGAADVVLRAPAEAGPGAVWMEVNQYVPRSGMRHSLAGRDSRLIAATLSQGTGDVKWESVAAVTYRYWPTGEAYTFRDVNAGYLRALLANVARGLAMPIVIPRALSGYEHCRGCAYLDECWRTGWESLPLIDAGLLGLAERARESEHALT